jgi:hypothetical protein
VTDKKPTTIPLSAIIFGMLGIKKWWNKRRRKKNLARMKRDYEKERYYERLENTNGRSGNGCGSISQT